MSSPLRVVVGTAGHVDHGKTALVKALTGIDTDRLPEEKRRGITLEAGYAHLELPGIGTAGVVDVPGHERFLRAMVGAAFGIDVAVLCVAADEGPMPQTAEHLDVLRLLGVQTGVIAMTKADLLPELGAEHRELLTVELRELVEGTFLEEAPIIEVSARTGKGLPELVRALADAVKARQATPRPEQAPLFLPLDRSFAVKGFGTVVTGTLFSGALAPGERAVGQLRLGRPTAAIAGLRFLLRGELPKSSRGHHPMVSPSEPMRSSSETLTRAARAHASTLGGGRILAVAARKRRRRESDAAALQALAGEDPLAQAERLLLESGYPGASPQRLAARGAFTVKSAEKALERLGQTGKALLYDREARLYVHKEVLEALDAKVLARLHEHAARDSIDPSIAREELRQRAGSPPPKLFAKALASLAERGELRADAERVHPPGTAEKLAGPDADAQEKLAGVLEKAGLSPPRVDELPALIGQTPHRTSSLLKALAGAGRASKVSEDLWFGATALMDLRRRVLAHLSERGSIDAQSFKELTGLTRKFAIPLLEYFDREKLTLRIGDKRVLRKGER